MIEWQGTGVTHHMANITIYSTPTCGYCKMAKEYLTSKNIPYTEVDVSTDRSKQEEMIAKSGQYGVPVIDVDSKIIVGFDKRKLDEYAGIKN
jgi:glutaredoxin 3